MDEPEISRQDVQNMVRLAVSRAMNWGWFKGHNDLDEESLFADVWGELVKAKYDPSKMQPHSFAYTVAIPRLKDIKRSRSIRIQSRQEDEVHPRERFIGFNDPEGEISEIARKIYVSVLPLCDHLFPAKPPGPGRPTPTFAQKTTITMLIRQMGWSYRDAEENLGRYPGILKTIGVSQFCNRDSFCKASRSVSKFARKQKKSMTVSEAFFATSPAA